ncbi:MAG: 3'-5' exonuclease, partial [Bacteroidota bacterium]
PLFFIGDPKQAIYAFRGADVFAYLEARADADRRLTLGTNYRSAPDLVRAVNALFSRLGPDGRPFVYDGIPFEPVAANATEPGIRGVSPEAPFVWWAADDLERGRGSIVTKGVAREAVVEATVTEICRLLNDERAEIRDRRTGLWRRLEAGDLAVLVRKNAQAHDLQERLRYAGVVAVVGKGDDIRQSREMDEIERVLRAMARPTDTRRVRAALATEMWGWTAADLAEASGDAPEADARLLKVMEGLRKDRALWRRRGVFGALTEWVRREGVRQRLHHYTDRERRLTNLRHCMELLHEAETTEDRSVDELLHWVRTRDERTFAERQRVEMRLESDDHAVQLVTMHNAKGLEYPVVFAPFVWDEKDKETWFGTFEPRPPVAHVASGGAVYDLGSEAQEAHRALADAERLAESLRLTYVAMTRARERLYVAWGPLSGGHVSGLGHLLRRLPLPLAE